MFVFRWPCDRARADPHKDQRWRGDSHHLWSSRLPTTSCHLDQVHLRDIKALYQYFVWSFEFPRNGRLMSENSEGVVMSQSDNRYNLILLGSHLSHPAIGKLFLSNIIHLHSELSFCVCFTLFSQQKIFINRKLNFYWVNLPWQWWWDYVGIF